MQAYSFFSRCNDEWLIGEMGERVWLKATVSEDKPDQPPATGWKFYNWDTEEYEADESVTCEANVAPTPCCLTVSLGGAAKEVQGECEGEYKDTGLLSMGRKASRSPKNIRLSTLQNNPLIVVLLGFQIRGPE